jgi:hypothetical protein
MRPKRFSVFAPGAALVRIILFLQADIRKVRIGQGPRLSNLVF